MYMYVCMCAEDAEGGDESAIIIFLMTNSVPDKGNPSNDIPVIGERDGHQMIQLELRGSRRGLSTLSWVE